MAEGVSAEVQDLFERIAACRSRAVSISGTVFRSVSVRYANAGDFLSGGGAAAHGGRWNPVGVITVYASLDVVTATRECYGNFRQFGFSGEQIRPRVMAGARVRLQRLLDLCDGRIRRTLGFTLAELVDEDWSAIQREGDTSWTQTIGRGSHEAGFEGLIAPSIHGRPRGKNLVYFPEKLTRRSRITLLGRSDLPPQPSEWPL